MIANNSQPNFFASELAPNPSEYNGYWIDLNANKNGDIIKYWDGTLWKILNLGLGNALDDLFRYRGTIDLPTSEITQEALTNRLMEIMGREPAIGDVLIDNTQNGWYWDGDSWNMYGENRQHSFATYNLTNWISSATPDKVDFELPVAVAGLFGVYLNGQRLVSGTSYEFVGDKSIHLYTTPPQEGDTLTVDAFQISLGGPEGPAGTPGMTGVKGDNGQDSTITIVGVETIEAGMQATVDNQGTPSDAKLYFRLPKGDIGDPIIIKDKYNTEADLIAAHPTGAPGDYYIINGQVYTWYTADGTPRWLNLGYFGPAGQTGAIPAHRWLNTTTGEIQFQNPDGSWGQSVVLGMINGSDAPTDGQLYGRQFVNGQMAWAPITSN